MTVTCPSCKRRFRLQDDLIKSPYQKMRCSQCGQVFVYKENETEEERTPPLLTPPGMIEVGEAKKEGGRKKGRVSLFAVVIAVILAAYGYYYWTNDLGASDRWLRLQNREGQETFIKDGRAFFIKGMFYNGSTKPRAFAMLKARLFDERGAVLSERAAPAGLQLSKADVEKMDKPGIEAKISEFKKTGGNALVIGSHKEIPFTIIFPDYPGRAKQFSVEIQIAPRQ